MARAQRGEPSGLQEAAWPLRVPTFSKKRWTTTGRTIRSRRERDRIPSFSIHSRTHPLNGYIILQPLYKFKQILSPSHTLFSSNCKIKRKRFMQRGRSLSKLYKRRSLTFQEGVQDLYKYLYIRKRSGRIGLVRRGKAGRRLIYKRNANKPLFYCYSGTCPPDFYRGYDDRRAAPIFTETPRPFLSFFPTREA